MSSCKITAAITEGFFFFFSFGSLDFTGLLTGKCGGRLCESLCELSFERVICGLQKMSDLRLVKEIKAVLL